MLKKMQVFGPRPGLPLLPIGGFGPNSDLIQIRSIEGLGPVKANVNTTPFGTVDGESYSGSTTGKRNIVLTLGLHPDWNEQTYASLRHLTYQYFMSKQRVKLRFFSEDIPDVEILGYVESFEPNIFSKDPEAQISVICPLPDFIAVSPSSETGDTGDGSDSVEIDYAGSVPAGFVLEVHTNGSWPTYDGTIGVAVGGLSEQVFEASADIGDGGSYFKMSSIQGQKYARVVDGSDFTSVMNTIGSSAKWPLLMPGANDFSVLTTAAELDWSLAYYERFGAL